jgi:putative oxidoreductase
MLAASSLEDLGLAQHLTYALQLSLGTVFLLSALPKLRDPAAFAKTVLDYEIAGPRLSRVLAPAVIALESFLAVTLLTGGVIEVGLALAAATVLAFAAVTTINLRRDRDVSCGCFGDPDERISGRSLARLCLVFVAILAVGTALAAGSASAITVADLRSDGPSALSYVLEIGGIAAALVLTTALLLRLPEVAPILRYLRPSRSSLPTEGSTDPT